MERPELSGGRATFLKVIVHLTSSPAKTTCSCQRTKTRMLLLFLLLPIPPELGASGDMVSGNNGGRRTAESGERRAERWTGSTFSGGNRGRNSVYAPSRTSKWGAGVVKPRDSALLIRGILR